MRRIDPLGKQPSSFSILLLRNDSRVMRFRLNGFLVKFLALFFVVFSGTSGAAAYAAHYYWKKYNILQHERSELRKSLEENRKRLDKYAGIAGFEKGAQAELPRSSMAGIEPVLTNGNGAKTAKSDSPDDAPASDNPAGRGEVHNGSQPDQPSDSDPGPAPDAGTVASHPAQVEDVQIKAQGSRYRLSFDLSNKDQQMTLNGRVMLAVSTDSGAKHEITQVSRDTLRFRIDRYKKVSTTFSLPPDTPPDAVKSLHITVTAENLPDVTYTFSFEQS